MAALQQWSDSGFSVEEHGLGPSGTQLVWENETLTVFAHVDMPFLQ